MMYELTYILCGLYLSIGDTIDLCADKKCGDDCANTCGLLQVVRFCQPDGSCGTDAAPKCVNGKVSYMIE